MRYARLLHRSVAATMTIVMIASVPAASAAAPKARKAAAAKSFRQTVRVAQLPVGTQRPSSEVLLSIGQGQLVTLPTGIASVWTSNPEVADVYVNNPRQINIFARAAGEATIFATSADFRISGGDRMMLLPETRIMTPAS